MMKYLLLFSVLLLGGCQFQPLPDPKCMDHCLSISIQCKKHEQLERRRCQSDQSAYKINIQEQQFKGQEVIRELNSYRDPLQCRNDIINCREDYQACVQLCKGRLYKRLLGPKS